MLEELSPPVSRNPYKMKSDKILNIFANKNFIECHLTNIIRTYFNSYFEEKLHNL